MLASLRETYATPPLEWYPQVYRMREALLTGAGEERARWFVDTVLGGIVADPPAAER